MTVNPYAKLSFIPHIYEPLVKSAVEHCWMFIYNSVKIYIFNFIFIFLLLHGIFPYSYDWVIIKGNKHTSDTSI